MLFVKIPEAANSPRVFFYAIIVRIELLIGGLNDMLNEGNTNGGGWDSEREKALTAREKHLIEQETAMIDKGLSEAFSRAGGKQTAIWDDPDDISPFAAIKSLLKDKLHSPAAG